MAAHSDWLINPNTIFQFSCDFFLFVCCDFLKKPTICFLSSPSVRWFITALKGPPLADVRQMALDRLSLQRPHTALLQELKVTVVLKLLKLSLTQRGQRWDREEIWKEGCGQTETQICCSYRKHMRGWRNWYCNEWTDKGTALPFLTSTAATHQHVLPFQRSQQTTPTRSTSLSSKTPFCSCLLMGEISHESLLSVQ